MSSGLDKKWIYDDKIDHEAYRIGILDFMKFLVDKDGRAGYHSCPCRKCLNRSGQFSLDDIAVHLLDFGMDKSYELWHYHGEHEVAVQGSGVADVAVSGDSMEELGDDDPLASADPIVNGALDEDFVDVGNLSEAPPACHNHNETKYERLKRLAKRPLYPPSHNASKHSLMDALVKLNDLKTEFSLSNAAVEGMLGLLKELLPKGNTLGSKFHEMKCTLKEVELNCVSYDVCENNCMLFWKEHINSSHCTKCNLSRYKVTCVVGSGNHRGCVRNSMRKRSDVRVPKYHKVARKVMRYFPISTRCVESTICGKDLLASSFARRMLEEVDLQQVEWKDEMRSLRADNQQLFAEMQELAEGLKNGRYSNHIANHSISPAIQASSPSLNPRYTSQSFRSVPCEVRSHTGSIVAFGAKTPRGTTNILNGHVMGEKGVKVLLERVIDPAYAVWGGVQGGAETLGDVLPSTFLYWHEDFLPPILPPTVD